MRIKTGRAVGTPAEPAAHATTTRRRFLLALGVTGAGAAAVKVVPVAPIEAQDASRDEAVSASGYRESDHVRHYYRTTKI